MPPPPCCSQISIISAISDIQMFQWNVLSYIEISKSFVWSVGDGPLYWYVVEAYHGGNCPTLPDSDCGNYIEYHTVAATSLSHLCRRLIDMGFSKKIKSIKRWTKPALECDVITGTREGIDYSCNELIDIDFCFEPCFSGLTPSNICPGENSLVWYTEYFHINFPEVTVGQTVLLGQRLGHLIASPNNGEPHLHFGLGDGQNTGNIGQTIDLTDFYNFPARNERSPVSGPGPTIFTSDDIKFIKDRLRSPVDRNSCDWGEFFGSIFHTGPEYYTMDIYCSANSVPRGTFDQPVYCASGGPDILTTVYAILDQGANGYFVFLRHERQPAGSSDNYSFMGNLFNAPICCGGPNYNHGVPGLQMGFSSTPLQIITPQPKTINMKEATLNEIVPMEHNFNKSKMLGAFLDRNNLKLNNILDLQYNESSNSWQFRKALESDNELWVITSELAREGAKSWSLIFSFSRKVNGISKQSKFKIKFSFPAINRFFLQSSFYIKSKLLELSSPYTLESNSILDDIGIFEGEWNSAFMSVNIGEK